MRTDSTTRRLHRSAALLLTAWALPACSDRATATAPTPAAPSAGRVAPAGRDAPRASLRVLSVLDLGTLPAPNGYRSEAWRINDLGQVLGPSGGEWSDWNFEQTRRGTFSTFLWQAGRMTDLTTALGRPGMVPRGLSNGGAVVFDWGADSYRWDGTVTRLDLVPASCPEVNATDVNDAGIVSGIVYCEYDHQFAVVRLPGGRWQMLRGHSVRRRSDDWAVTGAYAVNRPGDVVGAAPVNVPGSAVVPALWTAPDYDRTAIDCRPECADGQARDVNSRRWVVGQVFRAALAKYGAFLWTPAGGVELIPPLAGDDQSAAYGIDQANRVVGVSWGGGPAPRAFVWTRRGGTQPLGTLAGESGSKAFGINDYGQVVGSSGSYRLEGRRFRPLRTRAVLWQLDGVLINLLAEQTVIRPGLLTLRLVVLGAPGFDPMGIDVGSLRLGDEVGIDTPPAVDGKGSPIAYGKDVNGDGRVDLVVEFPIPALVKNGDLTAGTTELRLTGALRQGASVDGTVKVTVAP